MERSVRLRSVILEPLGFLLIPDYSPELPKKLRRRMLCTRIWHKYQEGRLCLPEAATQLSHLPFLASRWAPEEIASLLRPRAVRAAPWMLQLLDLLRDELRLKLVCVFNSSAEDLQELHRQFPALFFRFDATVTCGEEGVGKPSLRFLQVALDKAGVHAQETLYLDSYESLDSIVGARSLGMHALPVEPGHIDELNAMAFSGQLRDAQLIRHIVCIINGPTSAFASGGATASSGSATSKMEELPAALDRRLLSTVLASAQQFFLEITAAHGPEKPFIRLPSLTSEGMRIHDNFTQFLIADLLDDARFLPMEAPPPNGLITCVNTSAFLAGDKHGKHESHVANKLDGQFYEFDACTLVDIPCDLDTTSIGLSVLHKFGKVHKSTLNRVLDQMLEHVSEHDGILQVYFDEERPRIDPVVVANAVFLFHVGKRGHEVERSERFVESVLVQRAYEGGTLYYNVGDAFLLSVARLVHKFKEHFTRSGMRRALEERLRERAKKAGVFRDDALALAMHVCACALCGLDERLTRDATQELLRLQSKADGSWGCYPFYRNGSNVLSWYGNEALTSAIAMAFLHLALAGPSPGDQGSF